jgi:hypothetical protein
MRQSYGIENRILAFYSPIAPQTMLSMVATTPTDTHVWVTGGVAPVFVRSEGSLFEGGPIWRIELASPVWPQEAAANSPRDEGGR